MARIVGHDKTGEPREKLCQYSGAEVALASWGGELLCHLVRTREIWNGIGISM